MPVATRKLLPARSELAAVATAPRGCACRILDGLPTTDPSTVCRWRDVNTSPQAVNATTQHVAALPGVASDDARKRLQRGGAAAHAVGIALALAALTTRTLEHVCKEYDL